MIYLSMEFPQGGRELADTTCTGLNCILEKRGCEKGGRGWQCRRHSIDGPKYIYTIKMYKVIFMT